MKNSLFTIVLIGIFFFTSENQATGKDPFEGICKDNHQTFAQCKEKAEQAYQACKASVTDEVEDSSLNIIDDKYSLKYCDNTFKDILKWCQNNCK
jgi:hypothetical protein